MNCPRCKEDLSKECVVFVFAYHLQDSKVLHENPGDENRVIQCSCGLFVNIHNQIINEHENQV